MRAVRSFDPCLPCGVHMYSPQGTLLNETRHIPTYGVQDTLIDALNRETSVMPDGQLSNASNGSTCC